jgi:hypothetical protein
MSSTQVGLDLTDTRMELDDVPLADPLVREVVRVFGGRITAITDAPENWQDLPRVWTTTVHPRHIRMGWRA